MATQSYTNGVTLTDAAEFNKFDTAAYPQLTGVAGTNTVTATGPANLTLATSPPLWFIPAVTNTGATTINITPSGGAALGAKNVFSGGVACVGGELVAGVPAAVVYDGTQYNIVGGTYYPSSFTATLTGCTTSPTGTVYATRVGNVVTLDVPEFTATSNTTAKTLTGMPVAFRPATQKRTYTSSIDNGAATLPAVSFTETSGVITLFATIAGGAWTASGTMVFHAHSRSYTVN